MSPGQTKAHAKGTRIRLVVEAAYRSRAGRVLSWASRMAASRSKPRMLYGYRDPSTGVFRKYTRVSCCAAIQAREGLQIGDHVWVGHYAVLDASEGLTIGEGVQIGAWCGVFTHGVDDARKLVGFGGEK